MRLDHIIQYAIVHTIREEFVKNVGHYSYDLFLFGSMLKDNAKGGDIDLILLVPNEILKLAKLAKFKILGRIYYRIGEQKIDLKIIDQVKMDTDPFYQIIDKQIIDFFPSK